MFKTQAIKSFLEVSTHPELASLYNYNMEVQVNVAQDGGHRVDGEFKGKQWHGWSDGLTTWKSFRIPYKANTQPEYTDADISFDIGHAEGIGMTGWDWVNKISRWVAFDFDAISGHSEKHRNKLNNQELQEIQERVKDIPWVTVRKSTSGKGLHLYIQVPQIPTVNHNEHAALARAILGMLSMQTRFDFQTKVDNCGGNMWVWHRKMKGTDGLTLLKSGTIFTDIPPNWRDHIPVISGRKKKIIPEFISSTDPDVFMELTGQRVKVQLDEGHEKLLKWLRENNCNAYFETDHWLLTTHTYILQKAHQELGLAGYFKTISNGTDLDTANCFCFPLRKGAWSVRRFTPGVAEDASWTQDGQGWTTILYNKEPTLTVTSKVHEGIEHPNGGFVFRQAELAMQAANALGARVNLPPWILGRKATLKEHKDGRLIMEIEFNSDDAMNRPPMDGWINERGKWKKVFNIHVSEPAEVEVGKYDDIIRHLVSEDGKDCGWVIKSESKWREEPLIHVKSFLEAMGYSPKDAKMIVGSSVFRAWTLVNRPFQPEIVGDRQWNRNAVQLRFFPTENRDNLKYPTWTKILNHCGAGIDEAIKENEWAKANGILSGGDYLKVWIASLFQDPLTPLPYLFFFGEQLAGKSMFYEAIQLLVTRGGVMNANTALDDNKYNGEMLNAILCYIEEIDLRKDKKASNKIKEWVTGKEILIHAKNMTPFMAPNSAHFCQMSNNHLSCPIFPGDTRITMIEVPKLKPEEIINKKTIEILLEKEAPDFVAEILNLEIPVSTDPRLSVPIVITDEKLLVEKSNKTLLESFIDEMCHHVPGEMLKFSEFYDAFVGWLDPSDVSYWTKIRVGRELPTRHPRGRVIKDGSKHYVGNISWNPGTGNGHKLVCRGDRLVPITAGES